MEHYCLLLIVFMSGMLLGLAMPRLCPRCKIEREWVRNALRFAEKVKKEGK